jgi:hypothetical protein
MAVSRLAVPGVDVDDAIAALRRAAVRARWHVRGVAGSHPAVMMPLLRARRRDGQFLAPVDDATEIVIEGFPRSGNTFAVAAFHAAQAPRDVRIAHHAHVPAQLLEGVRRRLPSVLLVREPEEAVCSFVVREPDLTPADALLGYLRFHQPLLPVRGRLVVATFAQATGQLGAVVRRVNARFGTSFREFSGEAKDVADVMARIERGDLATFGSHDVAERAGGRPSASRGALKDQVRAEYRSPRLEGLRARAVRAYETLSAAAGPGPGEPYEESTA